MPFLKKNFGKKRKILSNNKSKIVSNLENWPCNGQKNRFKVIFFENLKKKPLNFLIKLGKKKPTVMFLGAGRGGTISEFVRFTSKLKLKPSVDVFSLTKNLDPKVNSKIRKDFSANIGFEELNIKNSKFKFLENKYDLIIGAMSVGFHTKYPANSIFTAALMLKKGGKAYIEIDNLSTIFNLKDKSFIKKLKGFKFARNELYPQRQLFFLEATFNRMVKSYNPKLEFSFNFINDIKVNYNYSSSFVEVQRIK